LKSRNAQNYLKQVEKKDTIIRNKMVERERLKDIALGVTASSEGERVQSSGSKQKMADAIDKCVDIDKEINRLVDEFVDFKREVSSIIERLNLDEYDVLHKIYFQYLSLYDVADMKGKTYSWVTTVHGRALQNVTKILIEREQEHGND
jgi:nitrogen fixation/metabolism regulation signal transduction histidine kinase